MEPVEGAVQDGLSADESVGVGTRCSQQFGRTEEAGFATAMFFERGYQQTTIADIAAAADVAKMTVTNYFPAKEDLAFDRADDIVRLLADAVRERDPGAGVVTAVHEGYLRVLRDRDPIVDVLGRPFAELVGSTPALQVRERELYRSQEAALAEVLVAEFAVSPVDLTPRMVAAWLAGTVHVLHVDGRRRLLAGGTPDAISRALRTRAIHAFAALETAVPPAYRSS